jgi:large subunit ribosomal protein L23
MSKAAKKKQAPGVRAHHYDVIESPVITEKSTMASEHGKYLFNVRLDASKTDIRQAVEALFNVKVTKINTLVRQGKIKRFRNIKGQKSDVKKAVVTLAEGQSIDLQGGVK